MDYTYEYLKASENIPNAWESWAEYRQMITAMIFCQCQKMDKKRVAIYGAGATNDIDVEMLLNVGLEITLYDCDLEKVRESAIKRGYIDRVLIKYINVFNITLDDYYEIEDAILLAKTDPSEGELKLIRHLYFILERELHEAFSMPVDKYDLNVMIGLHSQVLANLAAFIYGNGYPDYDGKVKALLDEMNHYMVDRLHDELFKKERGKIIVGYEFGSYHPDEPEKIERNVAGAYESEKDITERIKKGEIVEEELRYYRWNFLPDKGYFMKYQIIG